MAPKRKHAATVPAASWVARRPLRGPDVAAVPCRFSPREVGHDRSFFVPFVPAVPQERVTRCAHVPSRAGLPFFFPPCRPDSGDLPDVRILHSPTLKFSKTSTQTVQISSNYVPFANSSIVPKARGVAMAVLAVLAVAACVDGFALPRGGVSGGRCDHV